MHPTAFIFSCVLTDGGTGGRYRVGHARWLKPAVTIALYVLVFYWTDAREIPRARNAQFGWWPSCVLLYMAGQAISALKWRILLAPVGPATPYLRLLGFYFTGMFFNLFLPTIVGGDAVKAVLLARETGAPARATMSVFMERNSVSARCCSIALVGGAIRAAGRALRHLARGADVAARGRLRRGQRRAVEPAALPDRRSVHRADAAGAGPRARRVALRGGVPYTRAIGVLVPAIVLSFIFQFIVIGVVFLNARALSLSIPLAGGRRLRAARFTGRACCR